MLLQHYSLSFARSNYSKNLDYCSKGKKMRKTNYSKNLVYCSKRKVRKTKL